MESTILRSLSVYYFLFFHLVILSFCEAIMLSYCLHYLSFVDKSQWHLSFIRSTCSLYLNFWRQICMNFTSSIVSLEEKHISPCQDYKLIYCINYFFSSKYLIFFQISFPSTQCWYGLLFNLSSLFVKLHSIAIRCLEAL